METVEGMFADDEIAIAQNEKLNKTKLMILKNVMEEINIRW